MRNPELSLAASDDGRTFVPTPNERTERSSEVESCTRIAASTVCIPSNVHTPLLRLYSAIDNLATLSAKGQVEIRCFSALRTGSMLVFGPGQAQQHHSKHIGPPRGPGLTGMAGLGHSHAITAKIAVITAIFPLYSILLAHFSVRTYVSDHFLCLFFPS